MSTPSQAGTADTRGQSAGTPSDHSPTLTCFSGVLCSQLSMTNFLIADSFFHKAIGFSSLVKHSLLRSLEHWERNIPFLITDISVAQQVKAHGYIVCDTLSLMEAGLLHAIALDTAPLSYLQGTEPDHRKCTS